jgi:hypothetical protein
LHWRTLFPASSGRALPRRHTRAAPARLLVNLFFMHREYEKVFSAAMQQRQARTSVKLRDKRAFPTIIMVLINPG